MQRRSSRSHATLALAAAACAGFAGIAAAQPAATNMLPQSIQIEHKETLEQLTRLSRKPGPVGVQAGKVLVLLKRHIDREREYILPPLRLLPQLADGKVTPDMAWALTMTDRVRAEREELFQEHMRITETLNDLVTAATRANDAAAKGFAQSAAADALVDLEILQPTLMLINDTLRSKLPDAR